MRRILIIITTFFCSYTAHCQSKNPFIYGEMGAGYGTGFAFKLGVNSIFNKDQIISVDFYYTQRPAPDVPSDYHVGLLGGLPKQRLYTVGLMYGKVLFARPQKIRYTLKGGLALGSAMTPTNYTQANTGIISFDANYDYTYHTVFNYGLVLDPTVEFLLGRGFGFSLGIFSLINPISSSAGVEGSMIFGKVRNRRVKRTR